MTKYATDGMDSLDEIKRAVSSATADVTKELNQKMKEEQEPSKVVLFFSYDIVNSTSFKSMTIQWPRILLLIFNQIREYVNKAISNAESWRILGDEIVFIVTITSSNQLFHHVHKIFSILQDITREIESGGLFINESGLQFDTKQIQRVLSLKAASWIARIDKEAAELHDFDNLSVEYELGANRYIKEFLGNDIDEGFRLSKQVCQRRMVVSFMLALLLSEKTEYLERLIIVSYETLKGIWSDRPYPVIWYYDADSCGGVQFEDSFYYDEAIDEKLSRKYFLNRQPVKSGELVVPSREMYCDTRKALIKVCSDQCLFEKRANILKLLKESSAPSDLILRGDTIDLDCVAVCFTQNGEVLVARHQQDQKCQHPNKWHFGGDCIARDASLNDHLERTYRIEFGITINLLMDCGRNVPKPVCLNESACRGIQHKGIIIAAEIVDKPEDMKPRNHRNSEVSLLSMRDAEALPSEDTVPYFHDTLRKAYKLFNEQRGRVEENDAN